MTTFDFHNLLYPTEFENLCCDIINIREKPITFTTYKTGKDGGIDFRSTNSKLKIIGQCKLYNPSDYNSFLSSLKKELENCKQLEPARYIICTNLNLLPQQADQILKLFQGYILNEEDIIDGVKLNRMYFFCGKMILVRSKVYFRKTN